MSALLVMPDGTARGVYTEAVDLAALGQLEVSAQPPSSSTTGRRPGACSTPRATACIARPRAKLAWLGNRNT